MSATPHLRLWTPGPPLGTGCCPDTPKAQPLGDRADSTLIPMLEHSEIESANRPAHTVPVRVESKVRHRPGRCWPASS